MFTRARTWFDAQSFGVQLLLLFLLVFVLRTWGFGLYQVPTGSMETTMLQGERFFADKFTVLFTPIKRGNIISFLDPTYSYASNKFMNFVQRYVSIPLSSQYAGVPLIGGPSNWTKRVIGIPGDHVQGRLEDGKAVVYRNGIKLDEPYVNKYPLIALWTCDAQYREKWEYFLRNQHLLGKSIEYRSFDESKPYAAQPFYCMSEERTVKGPFIEKLRRPEVGASEDVFDVSLGANEYWVMGDNRKGSFDSRGWGILKGSLIHGRIIFRLWSLDSAESWWIVELIKHPIDFFKRIRWNRWMQRVV